MVFRGEVLWSAMRPRIAFQPASSHALIHVATRQRQDARAFPGVIARMEPPDFIKAPHAVERVEIMRVAGGELTCFEITAAQVDVTKCVRRLTREKMKAQPAPIGS